MKIIQSQPFTPLPKDITPLGIELDPDTGVDLSNTSNDKK